MTDIQAIMRQALDGTWRTFSPSSNWGMEYRTETRRKDWSPNYLTMRTSTERKPYGIPERLAAAMAARTAKPWTREELNLVLEMHQKGVPWLEISAQTGRTERSLHYKQNWWRKRGNWK